MSTLRDIVQAVAELAHRLDELLRTDTANAAPELAQALGAQVQFNQAIGLLGEQLQQLGAGLEKLHEPLLHIDALEGLVSLLRPLQPCLARLVDSVKGDLGQLGLAQTGPAFDVVVQRVERGAQTLTRGQDWLRQAPSVTDMDGLRQQLEDLNKALNNLKVTA